MSKLKTTTQNSKLLYFYAFIYFIFDYGITYLAVKNDSRIEVNPVNNYFINHFGLNSLLIIGVFVILIFGAALFFLNRHWRDFLPIILRAFLIATIVNFLNLLDGLLSLIFHYSLFHLPASQIYLYFLAAIFFTAFYLFFAWRKKWGFWFCLLGHLSSALLIFLLAF